MTGDMGILLPLKGKVCTTSGVLQFPIKCGVCHKWSVVLLIGVVCATSGGCLSVASS